MTESAVILVVPAAHLARVKHRGDVGYVNRRLERWTGILFVD